MIEVQSRTSCEDLIKEKDKEIGKLVDELEEQERHIKEANVEIERLNNIINSLNDYLVRCLHYDMEWTYHLAIKETYEYLQKLKEDKE